MPSLQSQHPDDHASNCQGPDGCGAERQSPERNRTDGCGPNRLGSRANGRLHLDGRI